MNVKSLWLTFAVLGLVSTRVMTPQVTLAEGYPSRPVKVIVPYAAGAAADVIGRIVAQKLSDETGAQFFVENVPGAGGTIGAGVAVRAPADGYTVLVINQDLVVQPWVKAKVPYDPFQSFTPVVAVAAAPETISIHPSVPATSITELVTLLKAHPGKYTYATPGYGTSPHIAVERLFKLTHGLDVVLVPFPGGGPAVTSTIAGHTHILHITLPLVAEHIRTGALRGLAVAGTTRSKLLPDVLTLKEAGIPNHEVGYWTGILAPAGTPKAIIDLLNTHLAKVVSQPDVSERLAKIGFEPIVGTPEDLGDLINRESAEWGRVVRQANLKVAE